MKTKVYVGKLKTGRRQVFCSDVEPTEDTHFFDGETFGDVYSIVEGPFRNLSNARTYASLWNSGVHCTEDMAADFAKKERQARRAAQHGALAGVPRGFRKGGAPSTPRY